MALVQNAVQFQAPQLEVAAKKEMGLQQVLSRFQAAWSMSKHLRIYQTDLDEDFSLLSHIITRLDNLKVMEIVSCRISEDHSRELAKTLKTSKLLSIQLMNLNINAETAEILAEAIEQTMLKKIDLTYNAIGDIGLRAFSSSLPKTSLESISFVQNKITSEGVKSFAKTLSTYCSSLQLLDFSRNNIGEEGVLALAEALPFIKLTSLRLDGVGMTNRAFQALCEAIMQQKRNLGGNNGHVKNLFFGNNSLDVDSMRVLSKTLENSGLEKLMMNSCSISDEGLMNLLEGVNNSRSLDEMDLRKNRITDSASLALCDAVKTHRTMKMVCLMDTPTTENTRKLIENQIRSLHSARAKTMTALCSIKVVPRFGQMSSLQALPVELIRAVGSMLGEQ